MELLEKFELINSRRGCGNNWYGCIYTSKRGLNLFIGKAIQIFPNDEGGLIMVLEIDSLEQKLGTTDCILKQAKKIIC